jgi:hypothetical protein
MVRYFEAPAEEQKQSRFVCKRCGAENEHKSNECPVLIVRVVRINRIYAWTVCSV